MTALLPERDEALAGSGASNGVFERPVRRIAAVAAAFMALGAVGLFVSQGDASAAQAAAERTAIIERVQESSVQNILGRTEAQRAEMFSTVLAATDKSLATPAGEQQAWVDAARATCDALPTWAAESGRVAAQLSDMVGSSLSAKQVTTFAAASAHAYCPAQMSALTR